MLIGSGLPARSTTSRNFRSANASSDTLAANNRLDLQNEGRVMSQELEPDLFVSSKIFWREF